VNRTMRARRKPAILEVVVGSVKAKWAARSNLQRRHGGGRRDRRRHTDSAGPRSGQRPPQTDEPTEVSGAPRAAAKKPEPSYARYVQARRRTSVAALACALLASACGDVQSAPTTDAGARDATARRDAVASPPLDATPCDAPVSDAAWPDYALVRHVDACSPAPCAAGEYCQQDMSVRFIANDAGQASPGDGGILAWSSCWPMPPSCGCSPTCGCVLDTAVPCGEGTSCVTVDGTPVVTCTLWPTKR